MTQRIEAGYDFREPIVCCRHCRTGGQCCAPSFVWLGILPEGAKRLENLAYCQIVTGEKQNCNSRTSVPPNSFTLIPKSDYHIFE